MQARSEPDGKHVGEAPPLLLRPSRCLCAGVFHLSLSSRSTWNSPWNQKYASTKSGGIQVVATLFISVYVFTLSHSTQTGGQRVPQIHSFRLQGTLSVTNAPQRQRLYGLCVKVKVNPVYITHQVSTLSRHCLSSEMKTQRSFVHNFA